ncbi:MAG: hypothetical protein GX593_12875 [Actinomycetales bacterium]|nr:hypothetical protein [Actinomycetales bacterium]
MDTLFEVLAALIPSLGVGLLFYLAIRALINADRNERTALARLDAQMKADEDSQAETPSST